MSEGRLDDATRRHLLKATGSGVLLGGLAGCTGTGNDDPDTTSEESGEPMDSVFTNRAEITINRKDIGFNDYNSKTDTIRIRRNMSQPYMNLNHETNELEPRIVEEVTIDGTTMTAKVSDEYGWSNGTPITAQDLETDFTLQIAHDFSVTTYVDEVTAKDDRTVEFTLTGEANPEILKQRVFDYALTHGTEVFGEYADRLKNASDEAERKAIKNELANFTISLDENTDKLITSGPVKFKDATNKRLMTVPNEHHPNSDAINFDGMEFRWAKDQTALQSMFRSDNLDVLPAKLSKSYLDTMADHQFYWELPAFGGNSIDFYLQDELYGDYRVRQAFNYILDQKKMTQASDYISREVKYFAGTPDNLAEEYIPEEDLSKFPTYEPDADKATSLLEAAGFSQSGDTWKTPSGDEWTPEIGVAASSTDRIKEVNVAVEQLGQFGINASMKTQEASSYWRSIRQRDYQIATYAWGDRMNRHPWFDYDYMWIGDTYNDQGEAWNGLKDEVKVPGVVGDPDSPLKTWNLKEMVRELGTTQDEKRQTELITRLAWMYNQYLPKLPINQTTSIIGGTRDAWKLPEKDWLEKRRANVPHLFAEGKLQAKTK